MCARKPAPIQLNAWGEPTGPGVATVDYLLRRSGAGAAGGPRKLRRPDRGSPLTIAYWVPDPLPEPAPLPALARGHVTFGSFNRQSKVLDAVLRVWAEILRACRESRLAFKDRMLEAGEPRAPILAVLAEQGITPERVAILDHPGRAGHFAA